MSSGTFESPVGHRTILPCVGLSCLHSLNASRSLSHCDEEKNSQLLSALSCFENCCSRVSSVIHSINSDLVNISKTFTSVSCFLSVQTPHAAPYCYRTNQHPQPIGQDMQVHLAGFNYLAEFSASAESWVLKYRL